ncbi:kunitz-type protease inhibitor 2-like [Drosophila teissieri]|uniref:kunitz-type protease inhibitor 2-like n=1 Tax=Drosophila teissieri TaxID=7243 RepID=UPI001CB9F6CD|nr:kunitz-type protease inhibitor 2-like [Drosophila teissieri]
MKLLILLFVFIALATNSLALKNIECGLRPAANGRCLALFRVWTYVRIFNRCIPFNYGGCDGNENQFDFKEQCIDKCVE